MSLKKYFLFIIYYTTGLPIFTYLIINAYCFTFCLSLLSCTNTLYYVSIIFCFFKLFLFFLL